MPTSSNLSRKAIATRVAGASVLFLAVLATGIAIGLPIGVHQGKRSVTPVVVTKVVVKYTPPTFEESVDEDLTIAELCKDACPARRELLSEERVNGYLVVKFTPIKEHDYITPQYIPSLIMASTLTEVPWTPSGGGGYYGGVRYLGKR